MKEIGDGDVGKAGNGKIKLIAGIVVAVIAGFVFLPLVDYVIAPDQGIGGIKQSRATIYPSSYVNPLSCNNTNAPITITATANDNSGSGIKNVTLYYYLITPNYTFANPYYGTPFAVDSASPWEWNFTFPNGEGEYWFYTEAVDNEGYIEHYYYIGPRVIQAICNYTYLFPFILEIHPANNTLNVSTTNPIVITFNAPMNISSVESSISLTPSKRISKFEWNENYTTLTVIPPSDLASYVNYTLIIDTSAKDAVGNSLDASYSWSFITGEIENNSNYFDYWILMILIVIVICIVAIPLILRKKKHNRLNDERKSSEPDCKPLEQKENWK